MNNLIFSNQGIFGDFYVVTGGSEITSATTYNFKVLSNGDSELSNTVFINNGNMGVGVPIPSESLDVSGKTKTTSLQVTSGAQSGYVLTSDVNGNATWQPSAGGPGGGTFTGGTVSGETTFTGGLIANTISATTYYNIPTRFGTGANNNGGTINSGVTGYVVMTNSGRITGWDVIGSVSGSIVLTYVQQKKRLT